LQYFVQVRQGASLTAWTPTFLSNIELTLTHICGIWIIKTRITVAFERTNCIIARRMTRTIVCSLCTFVEIYKIITALIGKFNFTCVLCTNEFCLVHGWKARKIWGFLSLYGEKERTRMLRTYVYLEIFWVKMWENELRNVLHNWHCNIFGLTCFDGRFRKWNSASLTISSAGISTRLALQRNIGDCNVMWAQALYIFRAQSSVF
jgi:hypothetical protein